MGVGLRVYGLQFQGTQQHICMDQHLCKDMEKTVKIRQAVNTSLVLHRNPGTTPRTMR